MSPRRYTLNEGFLDTLDTPEKSYFLGMMYADGCNHWGSNAVSLCLQSSDSYLLKYFKDLLGSSRPLSPMDSSRSTCLKINSLRLSDQLAYFGCVPRKTSILKFPNFIPDELMVDFIRGVFDGDGCFSYGVGHRKGIPILIGIWNITSSKYFVTGLRLFLLEELGINLFIRNGVGCVVAQTKSFKNIKKLYKWMYYTDDIPHLTRKKNKFDSYLSIMENENKQICLLGKRQDDRKIISLEDAESVIKQYELGESTISLASKYGVCHATISKYINGGGSVTRSIESRRKLLISDYSLVVDYYERGMTISEISQIFNVSFITIQRCLKKCGINTRVRGTRSFYREKGEVAPL